MGNKYLSYDDERAPKVRKMFSRLAWRYDLVNDVMSFGLHRRWKRQTVALALGGFQRPMRLLDLCCGTGDLCFLTEEMGGPVVRISGVDFTLPMLAVASRRKQRGRNWRESLRREMRNRPSWSQFLQADALELPFPSGTFDAVTIGYGLRNLADVETGLKEMRRVIAPGGRAVILDFGKPDNPIAGALYQGFLRTMMPAVGWLFHGDPETYLYIPESLKRYPAQRGVEEIMRKAGFINVRYENRLLGTMGLNIGEAPS